jgi:hypothetical protein
MLPCDICGKAGHSWFDCPKRSTKSADWKPERLRKAKVETRIASHQRGKSAYVAMATEAALNAGKTVTTISRDGTVEVRGPGAAKDITPIVAMDFATPTGATMHLELPPPSAGHLAMLEALDEGRKQITEAFAVPSMTKRPPGRPKSIEDMRAYKAAKQREYRQRKAAEKEAGK